MAGVEFEDFEDGSDEAPISTSLTSYDLVDLPGTGTAVFDSAWSHSGSLSMRMQGNGSGNYASCRDDLGADDTSYSRRVYVKVGSLPTVGTAVLLKFLNQANSLSCQACMNTDGTMKLQNSSSGIIGTATSTARSVGDIVRIELRVSGAVATMDLYYSSTNNLEGSTPDDTRNGAITQGSVGKVDIGVNAPGVMQAWFDDDGYELAGAAVGPKLPASPTAGDLIIDRS